MTKKIAPTLPRPPYGPPIEDALKRGDMKALAELLATVHGAVEALAQAKPGSLAHVDGALSKSEYAKVLEALKTIRGAIGPKR